MSEGNLFSVYPNTLRMELGFPLERFLLAYALTAASLVGFGYVWGDRGFEMLVVAMGWPHVLLGFLFYCRKITSTRSPHRPYFWLFLLLTFAIWFTHAWVTVTTLIYLYFVFHAFRDEIFIYRQRRTGFSRPVPILDKAGLIFLIAVVVLSGVDQLSWNSWRPVLRTVEVPLAEAASGEGIAVSFEPIEASRGRDYYFEVEIPRSREPLSFLTYFAEKEDATGRMFVDRRHFEFTTGVAFGKDLLFEPGYSGTLKNSHHVEDASAGRFPMTDGHTVGQTFRAEEDRLGAIFLPLAWEGPADENLTMTFTLQSALAIQYPFLEPVGLIALTLVLSLVVFRWRRRSAVGRSHEATFFLLLIALLFAARVGLDASRHYLFIAPLFFTFLVVFHYFSWYAFSLEKIDASRDRESPPPQTGGWLDRILNRIGSRSGFVQTVVLLNLVSLGGVLAYHELPSLTGFRYAFDMEYFLYLLVFHVTMSFAPKTLAPNIARNPEPV